MVVKSFKEEIELLDKSEYIVDKLQLFSVYQDLYRSLVTSFNQESLMVEYGIFLSDTFINIINNLNKVTNINIIIQEFLKKIKENKYFNLNIIEYIDIFEYNLDKILKNMKASVIINNTNYPFKIKVMLLGKFKIYIEKVISNLNKFYEEDSVNNFKVILINELINNLETFTNNTKINNFLENLFLETKNIFINSYYKNTFNFFDFKNTISKDFVYSLSELEKELFMIIISDIIIDFDSNPKFVEKVSMSYFDYLAKKYNVNIEEIINRLESVNLKIVEFETCEFKLNI